MKYSHKIRPEEYSGYPLIAIEGDLTSEADEDVKRVFSTMLHRYKKNMVIFDFKLTSYLNSSGIATLITIIQRMNEMDGRIAFVGLSGHFIRVMDIVGITDFVGIYDTADLAVAFFDSIRPES